MKKRTLNNEKLYSYRYGRRGLEIINNNPAHGVERRQVTEGKSPDSSLASRSLSRPAQLLRASLRDDEQAYEDLLTHITECVERVAVAEGWKIKAMPRAMAVIGVDSVLNEKPMSQAERARMCEVEAPNYIKSWKHRIDIIERWVKGWRREFV